METFTRCQQTIGTNSIDSLKELSKLIRSKHPSTKHKDIIAKALSLIADHLAETPAYMFNVYKNQPSRQTGSRNMTGQNMLPTKWGTYMNLVTKYQISAINIC
jgi:hypothetical protein